MRILLLGGTGAMGVHLSDIFNKNGYDVVVTSRKERPATQHKIYIKGNAKDNSFLEKIIKNKFDVIVDFMVYESKELTKERLSRLLSSTSQYVFLSSARVFGNEDKVITESSPRLLDCCDDEVFLNTDEYALAKAREENLIKKMETSNWTIVRPYITFSEIRLQLGTFEKEIWVQRALQGRKIYFSKDIASHYTTLTYARDVAKGIAGLIGNPKAIGEDFNITSGISYKWQEIADLYDRVLKELIPAYKGFHYEDECFARKIDTLRYQVKYCRLFDRKFDNSKILSVVPELKFHDVMPTLESCLREFLQAPSFLYDPYINFFIDSYTGEWKRQSTFPSTKSYIKYIIGRLIPNDLLFKIINNRTFLRKGFR